MIRQVGIMTLTAVRVREDSTWTGKVVPDPAANPRAGPVHSTGCSAPYVVCSRCAHSPHACCEVGEVGPRHPCPPAAIHLTVRQPPGYATGDWEPGDTRGRPNLP